jgi:hypothetical protein
MHLCSGRRCNLAPALTRLRGFSSFDDKRMCVVGSGDALTRRRPAARSSRQRRSARRLHLHCVLFLQAIGPSRALDTTDESFLQGYGHVSGTMGGGSDKGLNVTRGATRSGAGAVGKVRRSLAACWPLPGLACARPLARKSNILASSSRITKHRMEENLGAFAD